ncbi:MAG TPA: serine/threonine protein kinase [Candidatus Olsenella pullistercoris]|uniref:Serine/threonine protein kinase n=1 Tax=Candidatus Olsenella pullistercoris TaxID=2838712 RepID=A0A9D2EXI5_9ACTN|nr:serine/threonine protein kinase [Candidatus Olsenella pullistercoris]
MEDELSNYLAALERDSCYRVDAVLKEGDLETTERVYFVGKNGAELGPFVRKRLAPGLGDVYEKVLEAQRAGRRLPHLPRIVDCSRQDGRLVVVMEHVSGKTLAEEIRGAANAGARLTLALRLFPELCEAVAELSESFDPPLVHRDLKPSNVMVSEGGVTLIDLGIARSYKEGAERDTVRFGTRAYAPPEQFGFGQTSVASDVYALGMLLFFCLTGREPTARDREGGFTGSGIPEGVREVIVRATQFDPAARYAGPRELRDALLKAIPAEKGDPSEPPTFERPGLRERLCSMLARVPRPVGVAWDILCVLFLVVLIAGCVMAIVDPTPENASWPLWYLAYSYAGFMIPLFATWCALILDRRPLRRIFPQLRRYTLGQEVRAEIVLSLVLIGLWIVVSLIARPA